MKRDRMNALSVSQHARGFTLIEVMVVVAIVAIMLTIAVPSFSTLLMRVRVNSEADAVASALSFARSEAMKRGKQVALCPANGPVSTASDCGNWPDWSAGYLVVLNPKKPDAQVLLRSPGVTHGDYLGTSADLDFPIFQPSGYTFWIDDIVVNSHYDPILGYGVWAYGDHICVRAGSWIRVIGACPT